MKRIMITVLAMVGVMIYFSNASAERSRIHRYAPIVISGFGDNEFAVKGPVAKQLGACIERIKSDFSDFKYYKLYISVKGASTRATGSASGNDKMSSKRAENLAAALKAEFPQAAVNPVALGYEANARQVIVEYKILENPKAIANKEMKQSFKAAIDASEQRISQAVKAEFKDYSKDVNSGLDSLHQKVSQVEESQKSISRLVIISGLGLLGLLLLVFIGLYSSRYKRQDRVEEAIGFNTQKQCLLEGSRSVEPAIKIFPVLPKKLAEVIAIRRDSNQAEVLFECPFNKGHKFLGKNATRHAKACAGYQEHFKNNPIDTKIN